MADALLTEAEAIRAIIGRAKGYFCGLETSGENAGEMVATIVLRSVEDVRFMAKYLAENAGE